MPKVAKTEEQADTKPYPTSPPPGASSQKVSSPQKSPGRKGAAPWTPQETVALFNALYVKRDSPNWEEVAKAVGRDKKSCVNRFERNIKKNLEDRVGTC